MLLLIKYTLLYGIVLMLVALGGMFSEHSGIINIALEGIMVIGGVAGVLTLTMLPADMSPFLVVLISLLLVAVVVVVAYIIAAGHDIQIPDLANGGVFGHSETVISDTSILVTYVALVAAFVTAIVTEIWGAFK